MALAVASPSPPASGSCLHHSSRSPNPIFPFLRPRIPSLSPKRRRIRGLYLVAHGAVDGSAAIPSPRSSPLLSSLSESLIRHAALLVHVAASTLFVLGFGARARAAASPSIPSPLVSASAASAAIGEIGNSENAEEPTAGDEELKAALEAWKSKTFALTVPLRVVALRGSIPPSWIKEFVQAQGRRMKFNLEYSGTLESIFSELSSASEKGRLQPKSFMAADIISLGDSWLSYAISQGLIEPIKNAEDQDWYKCLSNKWKVHLRRNDKGDLDPNGYIWGTPYRWGTMVIAYKKNKFKKHNLRPIEDWEDLWRPELSGKISMVDSSREVIGAVLKYMGASYNSMDFDKEVVGGRNEVLHNLTVLQRQVRLFDSANYIKALNTGDVWVAVGWSSDIIPAAKRMSNVAVVVPKSGSSLWADLWAIPYATRFTTDQIGGRVRSTSPLADQWMEFCLQTSRELPFIQEVVSGASPINLDKPSYQGPREPAKRTPKLDTNLINGVPPPEILARCEFLEPLSEKSLEDHKWLISCKENPHSGWTGDILNYSAKLLSIRKKD